MRDGPLDTAPMVPRVRVVLVPLLSMIALVDIFSLFHVGIKPWLLPLGLSVDILGAIILATPDVPFIWNRFYAGKITQALERLEDFWRPPIVMHSPSVDDNDDSVNDIYSTGFNEILDALRLKNEVVERAGTPMPSPVSDIEWEKIVRFTFNKVELEHKLEEDGVETKEEERFVMYGPDKNDEHGHVNADWARSVLDDIVTSQERRTRRLGLGILIIGFTQQLVAALL